MEVPKLFQYRTEERKFYPTLGAVSNDHNGPQHNFIASATLHPPTLHIPPHISLLPPPSSLARNINHKPKNFSFACKSLAKLGSIGIKKVRKRGREIWETSFSLIFFLRCYIEGRSEDGGN